MVEQYEVYWVELDPTRGGEPLYHSHNKIYQYIQLFLKFYPAILKSHIYLPNYLSYIYKSYIPKSWVINIIAV